jgi:hypothetical protein
LTYTAVALEPSIFAKRRRFIDERLPKFESYEVGLLVSCGIYPEAEEEADFRDVT